MVKLLSIRPSEDSKYKYTATFETEGGRTKTTHFGAKGMKDYTLYPPGVREQHKASYLARHRVTENWNDPTSAGALSRWVLWNLPTVSGSIRDYKRRFNL